MQQQSQNPWYRDKRVLVTGAGGFIGSALLERLLLEGADVMAVVRGDPVHSSKVAGKLRSVSVDLTDADATATLFEEFRPEVVFNAASTLDRAQNLTNLEKRLLGTYGIAQSVVQAAVASGAARLVQFGTIEEYGSARAPFSEAMREMPISPYSLGKTMATHMACMAGALSSLSVCVVRPAATYGPGQRGGMLIPNLIKAALSREDFNMNPGEQLRDFVYVEDLVEGLLLCGSEADASGEILNLGSDKAVRVREVVECVLAEMGNPITVNFGAHEYRPNDSMEFYMDSSKAKKVIGWQAETPLVEGIRKTVDWYLAHQDSLT